MKNPAISREEVHAFSEACSDMGLGFQTIASRLLKEQGSLKNFVDKNFAKVDPLAGQIATYMLSVCIRVFEQKGGKLKKVNKADLYAAQKNVQKSVNDLLPLDDDFHNRAKSIEGRAQHHLLDEVLWALYERDELKEEEQALDEKQSALIYIMLWTAVEALDTKWRP
jgi:hypothetical protein